MSSSLVSRRLDSRPRSERETPLPLPSPPPRSSSTEHRRPSPYDVDRPNRHEYRPVLQNLPKMKKLLCKNCHGTKGLFQLLSLNFTFWFNNQLGVKFDYWSQI